MKKMENAICSNCEWSGDASGIVNCPVCGNTLAKLDAYKDDGLPFKKDEKYPSEVLSRMEEKDDLFE